MEAGTSAGVHHDDRGGPPRPTRIGFAFGGTATPLRAAAGVAVLLALVGIELRMSAEWGEGVFLALDLVGTVVVLGWGLLAAGSPVPVALRELVVAAEPPEQAPDGAITALLVSGLLLFYALLGNVTTVLGGDGGAGALTWTSLAFALAAAYPAWSLRSPVCALISSGALGVGFLAAVDWISDPRVTTYRWLLLVLFVAYATVAFLLLDRRPRHAVQHVTAAGVTVLILAASPFFEPAQNVIGGFFLGGSPDQVLDGPVGWEVVALLLSVAVLAFGIVRREVGPAVTGATALAVFLVAATVPGQEVSLFGWPLMLLAIAVAMVAAVFLIEDTA